MNEVYTLHTHDFSLNPDSAAVWSVEGLIYILQSTRIHIRPPLQQSGVWSLEQYGYGHGYE